MCKINGHSLFTYLAQPWNSTKLLRSKQEANNRAQQQQLDALTEQYNTQEASIKNQDLIQTTAKSVTTKKDTKRDLSSLRVPLNTANTGASIGGASGLGLNLGG